jgi:DNA topoisomerase-2
LTAYIDHIRADSVVVNVKLVSIEDINTVESSLEQEAKLGKQMNGKKVGRLFGIKKLDDANLAGTKQSEVCTLILTEGDSAKSLAMAGIEVVGRDRYGCFPLRGKFLNVREANMKQI